MTDTEIRHLLEGTYIQMPTLPGFYIKYDDFCQKFNQLMADRGEDPLDMEKTLDELYPNTKTEPCFQVEGSDEIYKVIRITPQKLKCVKEFRRRLENVINSLAPDSETWFAFSLVGKKVGKDEWSAMGFKGIRQAIECLLKNEVEFRTSDASKHEAPVQIRYMKATDKSDEEKPSPATTAVAAPAPLKKIDLSSLNQEKSPSKQTPEKSSKQGYGISPALDAFAYFPQVPKMHYLKGWDAAINLLASLALKERWYYDEKFEKSKPILRSYLSYTFERLQYEDAKERQKAKEEGRQPRLKILQNDKNAIFNTGLVNNIYDPIYAIFKRNGGQKTITQPWIFVAFDTANSYHQGIFATFRDRPRRAEYFTSSADLYYDLNANRPTLNWAHIIRDNIERLPIGYVKRGATPGFKFDENPEAKPYAQRKAYYEKLANAIYKDDEWLQFLTTRFSNALDVALSRVAWNYKTAIPVYYASDHKLSLLLPLALEKNDVIDVALVCEHIVNKESGANNYVGRTIFTLQMAYNNARLITRPDSDWLMADMCVARGAVSAGNNDDKS